MTHLSASTSTPLRRRMMVTSESSEPLQIRKSPLAVCDYCKRDTQTRKKDQGDWQWKRGRFEESDKSDQQTTRPKAIDGKAILHETAAVCFWEFRCSKRATDSNNRKSSLSFKSTNTKSNWNSEGISCSSPFTAFLALQTMSAILSQHAPAVEFFDCRQVTLLGPRDYHLLGEPSHFEFFLWSTSQQCNPRKQNFESNFTTSTQNFSSVQN
jgi:hypothetical protein